jgi:carbonic anhydrase
VAPKRHSSEKELSMSEPLSRRYFLEVSSLGVAGALAGPIATDALASKPVVSAKVTPHEALRRLIAGNRRWVTGRVKHPHQSVARRVAL